MAIHFEMLPQDVGRQRGQGTGIRDPGVVDQAEQRVVADFLLHDRGSPADGVDVVMSNWSGVKELPNSHWSFVTWFALRTLPKT
jgi:hypothetical protein